MSDTQQLSLAGDTLIMALGALRGHAFKSVPAATSTITEAGRTHAYV